MISNVSTINHNDANKTFHNQDPHTGEEIKRKKLELDVMRSLGYYDAPINMIHGRKGSQETRITHRLVKPEQSTFIPAAESMKAKFDNVLSGVKAAEGKEIPGVSRIDIRVTEDGAREKIKTTGKGAIDDIDVIVELSRSAKYSSSSYNPSQTA